MWAKPKSGTTVTNFRKPEELAKTLGPRWEFYVYGDTSKRLYSDAYAVAYSTHLLDFARFLILDDDFSLWYPESLSMYNCGGEL